MGDPKFLDGLKELCILELTHDVDRYVSLGAHEDGIQLAVCMEEREKTDPYKGSLIREDSDQRLEIAYLSSTGFSPFWWLTSGHRTAIVCSTLEMSE